MTTTEVPTLMDYTDWVSRALDAVDAGTDPGRAGEYITAVNELPYDDAVSIAPVVLLPMLADAARALAEQTGQAPLDIVAEWRKIAAVVLDGVAEGGGYE